MSLPNKNSFTMLIFIRQIIFFQIYCITKHFVHSEASRPWEYFLCDMYIDIADILSDRLNQDFLLQNLALVKLIKQIFEYSSIV